MKILLVAGARPNFMKMAPIAIAMRAKSNPPQRNGLRIPQGKQITPVPSTGATPVKCAALSFGIERGTAGQAQIFAD
jgi:hypothetical protein